MKVLLPFAAVILILIAIESIRTDRTVQIGEWEKTDPNREFFALGIGNVLGAISGAMPVGGSIRATVEGIDTGSETPVAGLIAASTVIVLLIIGPEFPFLPEVAFSALVLAASTRVLDPKAWARLWRFSRQEFAFATIALAGTAFVGPFGGLAIAGTLNLLTLVFHASRPNLAELGGDGGTPARYRDLARFPEGARVPGALLCGIEAPLFYVNAGPVVDAMEALANDPARDIRVVVFHLGLTPFVDWSACEHLMRLAHRLAKRGVTLAFSGARPAVEEALSRAGLTKAANKTPHYPGIGEAVAAARALAGEGRK